jgi:hypothetical protein
MVSHRGIEPTAGPMCSPLSARVVAHCLPCRESVHSTVAHLDRGTPESGWRSVRGERSRRTMLRTMSSDAIVHFEQRVTEYETVRSGSPLHRCDCAEVIAHQKLVVRSESTMGGGLCRPFPAQISVKVAAGA